MLGNIFTRDCENLIDYGRLHDNWRRTSSLVDSLVTYDDASHHIVECASGKFCKLV